MARLQRWSPQRGCDELLERYKDEAWRPLTDTVVMGYVPETIYHTYKTALISSSFAIEPMQAFRQLQQIEFGPSHEYIDVYASNILRCLRVLLLDSIKQGLECQCVDYCKDGFASKVFWAGLRNYPTLSAFMTQWIAGDEGFGNAVKIVIVALSNKSDNPNLIMSYNTIVQNEVNKTTEKDNSENKSRNQRDIKPWW
jgi:hypothetical protein